MITMLQNTCYKKTKNGIYLKVKVVVHSSRNKVVGIIQDRIKVTLVAAPQNGEANRTLEETLADFFKTKKSHCQVIAGHKSTQKVVFISNGI